MAYAYCTYKNPLVSRHQEQSWPSNAQLALKVSHLEVEAAGGSLMLLRPGWLAVALGNIKYTVTHMITYDLYNMITYADA